MTKQATITLDKQQLENQLQTMEFATDQLGMISQVVHCLARSEADPVDIEGALRSVTFAIDVPLEELRKTREEILQAMEGHQPPSAAVPVRSAGVPSAVSALLPFEAPLRMARGQADALHGALADTDESLAGAAEAIVRQLDAIWQQWEKTTDRNQVDAA